MIIVPWRNWRIYFTHFFVKALKVREEYYFFAHTFESHIFFSDGWLNQQKLLDISPGLCQFEKFETHLEPGNTYCFPGAVTFR